MMPHSITGPPIKVHEIRGSCVRWPAH